MQTFIGLLYVKYKVTIQGFDTLLNNFKEALVIAHQTTGKLLFLNRSAQKFNNYLEEQQGGSIYEQSNDNKQEYTVFGPNTKQFAPVDFNAIMQDPGIDSETVAKRL